MSDNDSKSVPETPKTVDGMYASIPAGIQGTPAKSEYETKKVAGNPMGVNLYEKK